MGDLAPVELVCNDIDQIAKAFAKQYDDFVFKCFEPYGINVNNITEFKDRVYVDILGFPETRDQRFYLDGVYVFTISIIDSGPIINGLTTSKTVRYIKTV